MPESWAQAFECDSDVSSGADLLHPYFQSSGTSNRWIWYPAILLLSLLVGVIAGWLIYEFQKQPLSTSSTQDLPVLDPKVETPQPNTISNSSSATLTPPRTPNLTGTWKVINTVEKTSYKPFANLRIGYRLTFNQKGTDFTAMGEKVLENGRTLPTAGRTVIDLTGTFEGETFQARFVEKGARRKTTGMFLWKVENDGTLMKGTFVSTAADSSGTSVATKEQ